MATTRTQSKKIAPHEGELQPTEASVTIGPVEDSYPQTTSPGSNVVEGATEEPNRIKGLPLLLLTFGVTLSIFQMSINATILGTVIPAITNQFHSIDDVGWYISSYLITNCAMSPFAGKLLRFFPLKATFIIFIAIFNIGTLLAGVAQTSAMLIVARAISGIGGSGILAGAMTCMSTAVPIAERSFLNGIILGCLALGQAVGPLIGGALTTYASWRWCFFVNLPIGAVVIILIGFLVKIPQMTLTAEEANFLKNATIMEKFLQIDLVGFFLFALANAMLLMGLEWGGVTYPWNSSIVIGMICGGLATFVVLALWFRYKGQSALIPTRFFNKFNNNAITITTFAQSGATFLALYWLPIWFQAIKESTAVQSGTMILPLIILQLVASVAGGFFVQKTGYYLPVVIFGNMLIAIGAGLTSTLNSATYTAQWAGYEVLLGAGRGLVMQVLVTAMQANVPKADASIASGFVMFTQYFGGAIFSSVAETTFSSSIPPALAKYAPSVNATLIVNSGATELRAVVPADQLPGVLMAYNEGLTHVFYLQLAAACCALITGWGMGWKSLKTAHQETREDTTDDTGDTAERGAKADGRGQ